MTVAHSDKRMRFGTRWGRPRPVRVAVAAISAGVLLLGAAAPASAAPLDDGLWYFDGASIGQAHADGWTGEGVTIAVLDSPINTDLPTLENANIEVREPSFCFGPDGEPLPATSSDLSGGSAAYHGSNVASLITGTGDGFPGQTGMKGVAPGADLLYYAVSEFDELVVGGELISCEDADGNLIGDRAVNDAMNEAMDAGADIISISSSFSAGVFVDDAYMRALREGVVVLGGVDNTDEIRVSMGFPAGANGAIGVQAADATGTIADTEGRPNVDPNTAVIAPGIGILTQGFLDGQVEGEEPNWERQVLANGTSLATPIAAGYLALAMQKWPDATGNQMIQSLLRNTGGENHELSGDPANLIGYGFVSATGMLKGDPSGYPDENPLITDSATAIPTLDEITAAMSASPEPTASPSPDAPVVDADGDDLPVVGIIVGIAVAALLLIGALVLVVLVLVRRSRREAA